MERIEEIKGNKDIINLIYKAQEEKLDKIIIKTNKEIKEELKSINIEKVITASNTYRDPQPRKNNQKRRKHYS